jgi:thiamine biosynthesis lipoprotein ApbE
MSLALRDVVAHCVRFAALSDGAATQARVTEWNRHISRRDVAVPSSRAIPHKARALGADTQEILSGMAASR